ncbi:MAG: tetratricopeptide repeat protein [Opitutaceae bacterium]|nr:tetratricopeptide repeat protein [Opitutaceae bacterium]
MTTVPSSEPQGKAQKSDAAPAKEATSVGVLGFEEKIHKFWRENRQQVLFLCAAVLLAIVVKEGWQYFSAMRERDLQEQFAASVSSPAKLAAFADGHSSHALGGVAYLTLADQKFESGDFKQAVVFYQKAGGVLENKALNGRARLGEAMSSLNVGDRAAGEAGLKAVAGDPTLLKATRSEAAYHLASLAADAGKVDEVKKQVEEIGRIDPASMWSQRAALLLVSLPGETGKTNEDPASPISFKTGGK